MVVAYQGTVRNGQLHLEDEEALSYEGEVIVIFLEKSSDEPQKKILTMGDLLDSPLIGMWADREDIEDSASFAEELRRKAERR